MAIVRLACAFVMLLGFGLQAQDWELYDNFNDNSLNTSIWSVNDGEPSAPDEMPTEENGRIVFPAGTYSSIRTTGTKSNTAMGFRADLKHGPYSDDDVYIQTDLLDYTSSYSLINFGSDDEKVRAYLTISYSGSGQVHIQPSVSGYVVQDGTPRRFSWNGANATGNSSSYQDVAVIVYADKVEFFRNNSLLDTFYFEELGADDFSAFPVGKADPKVAASGEAELDNAQIMSLPARPRISSVKYDGDNRTGTNVVDLTFKATGTPNTYQISGDADFADVLAGDGLPSPDGTTYTIEGIDLSSIAAVNGRKTVYLKVANRVYETSNRTTVSLVLPTVSAVKVNGNNRSGVNVVPVSFRASDAQTYSIYWLEGETRHELASGSTESLLGALTDYTVVDVDLSDVPNENGRKYIYVTCANEVGEAKRPAKVAVSLTLPVVASVKVNGNNRTGVNVVPVVFRASDAQTYTVYWLEDETRHVLASGNVESLTAATTEYTIAEVDLSGVPAEKGRKTIYVTCANEVGEAKRSAKVTVTLVLPTVTSAKVNNNNRAGVNTVPISFRASEAQTYTIYWDDGATTHTLSTGLISSLTYSQPMYTVAAVDLSSVAAVNGRRTIYVTCTNEVGDALRPAKATVTLVLPKVSAVKVNGNNSTGTSVVPVTFQAYDALTYTIYWLDGETETVLTTGDVVAVAAVTATPVTAEVDLSGVPAENGRKTIYVTCTNEVGDCTKPAKVAVKLILPSISGVKVNGNNRAGVNVVPVTFRATNAVEYLVYWLDGGTRQELASGPVEVLTAVAYVGVTAQIDLSDVPAVSNRKTVYVVGINDVGETARPITANVSLVTPVVKGFKLADGAAKTNEGAWITLDHTASNDPVGYRVSNTAFPADASDEDLPWRSYVATPTYQITGLGTQRVYFQVCNEVGSSPVVSDTILVEAFWTGTWVGTYQITSDSDADYNDYEGLLPNGLLIIDLTQVGDQVKGTGVGLDGFTAPLIGEGFDTDWFHEADGDDKRIMGVFLSETTLEITIDIENNDNGWYQTFSMLLTRPSAVGPQVDLNGVWIVNSEDVIDSWWYLGPDWGDSWYGGATFTSDFLALFQATVSGSKLTLRDLVFGDVLTGRFEPAPDGLSYYCVVSDSSDDTWASFQIFGASPDEWVAGTYQWEERWTDTWEGVRVEGGEEAFGKFTAERYTGENDLPNGTTEWELYLQMEEGDGELPSNYADARVVVSGSTITVTIYIDGDAIVVRGKVYDGFFVAKGTDLTIYGAIDGSNLYGTFEYDDGETWQAGTIEGDLY